MSGMMAMMASNVKNPIISSGGGGGGGTYATGGTVYDITGYKVHIFNAAGTFATTSSWPSGRTIQYLVVAGGGGSDTSGVGGGGGAGGLLSATGVTAAASTNYAVTIGAGGVPNTNGGNSSLIGGAISATSIGGGGSTVTGTLTGQSGGSGAGGGNDQVGTTGAGGAGTAGQGNAGAGATGKYGSSVAGGGGGAGTAGGTTYTAMGGDGLASNMLTSYSASTITISSTRNSWASYTFTVAAGLPFQANSAVYISNNATPSIAMFGLVVSYSGTTMVCKLDRYDAGGGTPTLSGWNIGFAHAGGGWGADQGSMTAPASMGGGGGSYGYSYPTDWYDGLPNSGGGGQDSTSSLGGSGVVMIKYAYP
jgi:hypothetical protein